MKLILLFGLMRSISSCGHYIRKSAIPFAVIYYEKDEFKETETAALNSVMIAAHRNVSSFITSFTIKKQIAPNKKQDLILGFELPVSSHVEKNFFFQIDSNRYQFSFDSIQYHKNETMETVVDTDLYGASTTTSTLRQKKSATLFFSIPDSIKNLLITSDRFVIRYYIGEFPYELIYRERPRYSTKESPGMSGSYTHHAESVSRAKSKARPIELILIQAFLMIESEADFDNYASRYAAYTENLLGAD
ncbi:MAG TPA: hypothetical protein ENK85_01655 [Saprospiraceae bacterium]|nr:hypothetical protein [Saprospiraceae bacterium]